MNRQLAIKSLELGQYDQAKEYLEDCREWPENLGVGKPYDPDERIEDYLTGILYTFLEDKPLAEEYLGKVVDNTYGYLEIRSIDNLLAIDILKKQGYHAKAMALLDSMLKDTPDSQKKEIQYILKELEKNPINGVKRILQASVL